VSSPGAIESDLFGLVARHDFARERLQRDPDRFLPRHLVDRRRWWIDRYGRAAMIGAPIARAGELTVFAAGSAQTLAQLADLAPRFVGGKWGALAEVSGSFALAVWDGQLGTLTLARDRIGQRSLHVREDGDVFWLSNDLELLLLGHQARLDLASAAVYLSRGHSPLHRTLALGVGSVPAAHCLHWEQDRATLARYWSPLRPLPRSPRRARARQLRDLLAAAVPAMGDRPQGVLLSGGVDSSFIACLAAREAPPPVGLTLATGVNGEDLRYAATVTKKIGARHVVVDLDAAKAARILPRVLEAATPASAWTAIGHIALFAEAAREGLSTVLSGMGADELFGGYDRFVEYFYRQRQYSRRWDRSHEWFDGLTHDHAAATTTLFGGVATFFDQPWRAKLLSAPAQGLSATEDVTFYQECRRMAPEANVVALMGAHEAQHRVPELLLPSFEPSARAAGIRVVYPFLDRHVAHLAMSLGIDDHFWFERGAWWAKRTLRSAARGVVPASIVMRPRIAYDLPITAWLTDRRFGRLIVDRLAATRLWSAGLFKKSARAQALRAAQGLTRGEIEQAGSAGERTWILLTLGAWYDRYIERR
jgi:asparagine synthase (glutamine-hydrolysing)